MKTRALAAKHGVWVKTVLADLSTYAFAPSGTGAPKAIEMLDEPLRQ